MIIFLKLLIAHLLGDFIFQSSAFVKEKEQKKIKSVRLYFHAVLHGLLSIILLWDISFWKNALIIIITHFLIDITKVYYNSKKHQREAFLIDQISHILILIIISLQFTNTTIYYSALFSNQSVILSAFLLFLTKPSSIFIKIFISKWTPEKTAKIDSLESAGNWIGILERLLIFVFIIIGKFEAVGFLLAAKSIFRFGDLKEGNDRKLTEYILIGTLSSFGTAIIAGILYNYLQSIY